MFCLNILDKTTKTMSTQYRRTTQKPIATTTITTSSSPSPMASPTEPSPPPQTTRVQIPIRTTKITEEPPKETTQLGTYYSLGSDHIVFFLMKW